MKFKTVQQLFKAGERWTGRFPGESHTRDGELIQGPEVSFTQRSKP